MGTIPRFQPHQPSSNQAGAYDLKAMQENIRHVLDEISSRPQLSGEVLQNPRGTDVEVNLLAAQENLVEHGLGKAVRGWRLIDIQDAVFVWRITSPTSTGYTAAKYLALGCSADVTVKIEVWA